jgi:hypothetical protein
MAEGYDRPQLAVFSTANCGTVTEAKPAMDHLSVPTFRRRQSKQFFVGAHSANETTGGALRS